MTQRRRVLVPALITAMLVVGCKASPPGTLTTSPVPEDGTAGSLDGSGSLPGDTGSYTPDPGLSATPDLGASGMATPSPTPGATPDPGSSPPAVPGTTSGVVLDPSGSPAAGVQVSARAIDAATAPGQNQSGVVDILTTTTDAGGHFTLHPAASATLALEAAASDDLKALALNVAANTSGITLKLDHTAGLTGSVSATTAGASLADVAVSLQGTRYVTLTDAAGHYGFAHIPVGSYTLVATKSGLGSASAQNVALGSGASVTAPSLSLAIPTPTITAILPANAAAGSVVTLTGADLGDPLAVSFGGIKASTIKRTNASTVQVTVPSGALTGGVVASVGGVASSSYHFDVIKALRITPRPQHVLIGSQTTFKVVATDTSGNVISGPVVKWQATNGASLIEQTLTGSSASTTNLSVASGGLSDTLGIGFTTTPNAVSTFVGGAQGSTDATGSNAGFNAPAGLCFDSSGVLYVADENNARVRRVDRAGVVSTLAGGTAGWRDATGTSAQLLDPTAIAVDAGGNLYVTEGQGCRIRRITSGGQVTTIAGSHTYPGDPHGYADGAGTAARFNGPGGIAVDAGGNLYVADTLNNRIRRVTISGSTVSVTTLAGSGTADTVDGTGAGASFNQPTGIAVGPDGSLYVSDGNCIRRIDLTDINNPVVRTIAGSSGSGFEDGDGRDARFNHPTGLAIASNGELIVADTGANRLRMVDIATPNATVTTVAGGGSNGFSDGPSLSAAFSGPRAAVSDVLDANRPLVVADTGNQRIRRAQF